MPPQDDDELDGCDLDFTEVPSTDEEVEYLPLFPDGEEDEEKARQWRALFDETETEDTESEDGDDAS